MAHWRKQKKKGTGDCFYRIKDFRFKMKFPRTSPICLALGINAFGLSDSREPNNTIYNNAISLFWLSFPLRLGGTKCPARGGKKLVWRTGSGVGGGIERKREDGCEMAAQEGQGLQGSCKVETKDIYTSHVKRLWKWVEACKAHKMGGFQSENGIPWESPAPWLKSGLGFEFTPLGLPL